jgi:choline dehydrogenase-like flavoprotein
MQERVDSQRGVRSHDDNGLSALWLICCHRSVKDPQILELSGIGRRDVLDKIGVVVKVELPGVGENLQDHLHFPTVFQLDPKKNHKTLDLMRDPVYAEGAMKS